MHSILHLRQCCSGDGDRMEELEEIELSQVADKFSSSASLSLSPTSFLAPMDVSSTSASTSSSSSSVLGNLIVNSTVCSAFYLVKCWLNLNTPLLQDTTFTPHFFSFLCCVVLLQAGVGWKDEADSHNHCVLLRSDGLQQNWNGYYTTFTFYHSGNFWLFPQWKFLCQFIIW